MKLCNDKVNLLLFCEQDPVRYRHLIHELDPPCPEWDEAMHRCHYVSGEGLVIQEATGQVALTHAGLEGSYYMDSPDQPRLLAKAGKDDLRIEGAINDKNAGNLLALIQQLRPHSLQTSHQAIAEFLREALNTGPWESDGAEYTPTGQFTPQIDAPVRALTPDDRSIWQRFVDRNADSPMVNAPNGSQAVVRDFLFMSMGLPVQYLATLEDGKMTGMASVNPMTRSIEEISALYVDPVHRRKGLARTLICAAVNYIHGQGRIAAYHAAGNPQDRPDLYRLLTSLGFELVTCPYTTKLNW